MEWELTLPRVQSFVPGQLFHPDEGGVSWWVQGKHQFYACFVRRYGGLYEFYKVGGKGWSVGSDPVRWTFVPTRADKNDLLSGRWWGVPIPEEDIEGKLEIPGGTGQKTYSLKSAVCARMGPFADPLALVLHFQRPSEYGHWCHHNDLHFLRCSRVPPDVTHALQERAGLSGSSTARSQGYQEFQDGQARNSWGNGRQRARSAVSSRSPENQW